MPKSPDAESQRKRERHLAILTIANRDLSIFESKRGLSLSDAPQIIRQGDGSQLSEIPRWPNLHICNAVQQLLDLKEVGAHCSNP